ncbi:hypothetical protein [Gluconobacter kondonii]|uniref:hypothetical protein n=1 Tax=Gluconobacter kondonii TaxID=941463 RepID=UPI001B8AA21B|nr:hypothetical protein [Gluconobacter kondonii]MBS1084568.1 hypothetical protein [Gluconobacter kondonii]
MFTIPKDIIAYLDTFRTAHGGTVTVITAAASLIAIVKSTLNTWGLNQQADIQREIQSNRYKLELFDKRFKVFTEFKQKINTGNEPLNNANVLKLKNVANKLDENIPEIQKLQLIFGSGDKKISSFLSSTQKFKQLVQLTSVHIPLLEGKEIEIKDINDDTCKMNGTIAGFVTENYKRQVCGEVENLTKELNENRLQLITVPFDYDIERNKLEEYLSEKLSVPEQAFEKRLWFFVRWRDRRTVD